jgi:hypothetical protein
MCTISAFGVLAMVGVTLYFAACNWEYCIGDPPLGVQFRLPERNQQSSINHHHAHTSLAATYHDTRACFEAEKKGIVLPRAKVDDIGPGVHSLRAANAETCPSAL